MKTSQKGVNMIKHWEGCSLDAVRLPGEAYYTIGYGHYGEDVGAKQHLTLEEAEALLKIDLVKFEAYVDTYIKRSRVEKLNQNQFDALISFAYNCGPGSLQQLVAARTATEIASHMMYYTGSANEAFRAGLTNRRRAERDLFLTPCSIDEEEIEMTKAELLSIEKTGDKPSSWAREATDWAKRTGLVAGDGNGNYGWQQPITREALVQILYTFAKDHL